MNKPETQEKEVFLGSVPARYWRSLEDGRIQCDLCPRYCRLREGQRGLCFVRARENDRMVLTSYGRSSGFCVDPIEKKPLNQFLPGTAVLSFGTAGCNLTCKFCQNWDISKATRFDRLQDQASPQAIVRAAQGIDARSVAFTYNDPVIFLEYAVAANIDLKGFTDDFYRSLCSAELQPILDTLEYVRHETDCWLEITTLLIPDKNDSPEELRRLSEWIRQRLGPDTPLHFSAFHPDWRMRDVPATPPATLQRARNIAMQAGLRYVYTGNVHDEAGQSTYCSNCSTRLIGRDWCEITSWAMTEDGRCLNCGATCNGVFGTRPGAWGSRGLPVRLANAS